MTHEEALAYIKEHDLEVRTRTVWSEPDEPICFIVTDGKVTGTHWVTLESAVCAYQYNLQEAKQQRRMR